MDSILDLSIRVAGDVVRTFVNVWPFLLISIAAAAAVTVYVGTDRAARLMQRRTSVAVGGAVLVATLTPFCSCGTTAVLLGGLATASPWAPLVAFMVASPLTSPSELVFSAGLFGWSFALVFFVGTIALGLASGAIAAALDRSGWLTDQARMQPTEERCASGSCAIAEPELVAIGAGPGTMVAPPPPTLPDRLRLAEFGAEFTAIGRKLLIFFFGFTTVGYLAIEAIPTAWLTDYLGGDSLMAVPLAALVGIPAYINTEASLPLLATFMEGGMGPGPALAFLVTGAGASIGAISGLFVIARKRVVFLVVALLFMGAMAMGWFGQLVL